MGIHGEAFGTEAAYTGEISPFGQDLDAMLLNNPVAVGDLMMAHEKIPSVILGAYIDSDTRIVTAEVLQGLVLQGMLNWERVRFPRIHRALGRVVVDKKRYYLNTGPIEG